MRVTEEWYADYTKKHSQHKPVDTPKAEEPEAICSSIRIVIPEVGPSANKLLRMNPFKRGAMVKKWHSLIHYCCRSAQLRPVTDYPVSISCTVYVPQGTRRPDVDNVFGTVKLSLDGLVRAGILKNDSPKYLSDVTLKSARAEGKDAYTVLEITGE